MKTSLIRRCAKGSRLRRSCLLPLLPLVTLGAIAQVSVHPANTVDDVPTADAVTAPSQPSALPDAPVPQTTAIAAIDLYSSWQASQSDQSTRPGFPPVSEPMAPQPSGSSRQNPAIPSQQPPCLTDMSAAKPASITCAPHFNPYQRFLNSSGPHPLTVRQKGLLAVRNVTDPFNFLTIAGESGIAVASDSHSPYGPGWAGFGRSVGVSYTETMVGNFFGVFLIPSLAHQDPHYHREPNAPIPRRVLHAITSVVWAQSDSGRGMINYANLGTTAIADALGDLYVPGAEQGFGVGVSRFATAIATDPIDNFVTEFLPDVAKRINVKIVLIQRVVNEVERQNGAS